MAWWRKAASHYLSQSWPRSLSPYGFTRPQWVKAGTEWLPLCIFLDAFRADSRFASSQWETPLLCNGVSHWLSASLESGLCISCEITLRCCIVILNQPSFPNLNTLTGPDLLLVSVICIVSNLFNFSPLKRKCHFIDEIFVTGWTRSGHFGIYVFLTYVDWCMLYIVVFEANIFLCYCVVGVIKSVSSVLSFP